MEVDGGLDEISGRQVVALLPDDIGTLRALEEEPPRRALDRVHICCGTGRQRELPRTLRRFQILRAERGMAAHQQGGMSSVHERTAPRRPRKRVAHRVLLGHVARLGMSRRFNPGSHAAILLLSRQQMAKSPFRLVEDIRNAVGVLRNRQLSVAEVLRTHEIDGAQVVNDIQMRGTPIIVGGVVPAADKMKPLAGLPVRVVPDDIEPACLRFELPFLGRKPSAHDLRMARARRPVRVWLLLRNAAPLLVKATHVDTECRFRRTRRNAERRAPPDTGNAHEIDALVRDGRKVHLMGVLAGEGSSFLGETVVDAVDWRDGRDVRCVVRDE